MDAVDLAKEFAEDCIEGLVTRDDLNVWLTYHDDLIDLPWSEIDPVFKKIKVILDSKIIITIK